MTDSTPRKLRTEKSIKESFKTHWFKSKANLYLMFVMILNIAGLLIYLVTPLRGNDNFTNAVWWSSVTLVGILLIWLFSIYEQMWLRNDYLWRIAKHATKLGRLIKKASEERVEYTAIANQKLDEIQTKYDGFREQYEKNFKELEVYREQNARLVATDRERQASITELFELKRHTEYQRKWSEEMLRHEESRMVQRHQQHIETVNDIKKIFKYAGLIVSPQMGVRVYTEMRQKENNGKLPPVNLSNTLKELLYAHFIDIDYFPDGTLDVATTKDVIVYIERNIMIRADEDYLAIAMDNLVRNCRHHREQGKRTDGTKGAIVISLISDRNRIIFRTFNRAPPKEYEELFRAKLLGNTSNVGNSTDGSGNGLGTYTAQQIYNIGLGGNIELFGVVNEPISFVMELMQKENVVYRIIVDMSQPKNIINMPNEARQQFMLKIDVELVDEKQRLSYFHEDALDVTLKMNEHFTSPIDGMRITEQPKKVLSQLSMKDIKQIDYDEADEIEEMGEQVFEYHDCNGPHLSRFICRYNQTKQTIYIGPKDVSGIGVEAVTPNNPVAFSYQPTRQIE